MKKKLISKSLSLLILCFVLTSIISQAQTMSFSWAKQIGGPSTENGNDITSDASGNVIVTGDFIGTVDFDPSSLTYNLSSAGSEDLFAVKLSSAGSLIWAVRIGGIGIEKGVGITTDASNNIYITGIFTGLVDFDPGPSVYNVSGSGGQQAFVLKLNSNGNLVWVSKLGATQPCNGVDIKVDVSGNVYTCGQFSGTGDFDPGPGTYTLSALGFSDNYISKLDASGNFVWAKAFGNTSSDYIYAIDLDASNNVYTVGGFNNTVDFDPGAGTNLVSANGAGTDAFLLRLDLNGNFSWVKIFSTSTTEDCTALKVGPNGEICVSGPFLTVMDLDPGPGVYNLGPVNGVTSTYLVELNNSGNFVWAGAFTSNVIIPTSIAFNNNGDVFLAGQMQGTIDFDPGLGTFNLNSSGNWDAYICKLNSNGNFLWAGVYGGVSNDIVSQITLDQSGNLYSTGSFSISMDADPSPNGSYIMNSILNSRDTYINKMIPCISPLEPVNTTPISNLTICEGKGTTLTATSSVNINWYASSNSTLVLATGSVYNTPTLTSGTYTFYCESMGCKSSLSLTSIVINVNAAPSLSLSQQRTSICSGETFSINVYGANSYTFMGANNYTPSLTSGILSVLIAPNTSVQYTISGSNLNNCKSSLTLSLTVEACLIVNEEKAIKFTQFVKPNPASSYFKICLDQTALLYIYDYSSKLVKKLSLQTGETSFSTQQMEPGLYLVIIESNGVKSYQRLIINQ